MATARKTDTAPTELDFDALLETATIEIRRNGTKERYLAADEVRPSVSAKVAELYESKGKKRLALPVTSKAQYDQIHAQFSAAAHHQNRTANVRSVYEGEGEDAKLVSVTITVSDKRTNKPADTAPVSE